MATPNETEDVYAAADLADSSAIPFIPSSIQHLPPTDAFRNLRPEVYGLAESSHSSPDANDRMPNTPLRNMKCEPPQIHPSWNANRSRMSDIIKSTTYTEDELIQTPAEQQLQRIKDKKRKKKAESARFYRNVKRNIVFAIVVLALGGLFYAFPDQIANGAENIYKAFFSYAPKQAPIKPYMPLWTQNLKISKGSEAVYLTDAEILSVRNITNQPITVAYLSAVMRSYIEENKYAGICAVHLGITVSFCMVVMEDGETIQEMFNMEIRRWSEEKVLSEENSIYCDSRARYSISRSVDILMFALNFNARPINLEFKNDIAATVQSLYELNKGIRPCDK